MLSRVGAWRVPPPPQPSVVGVVVSQAWCCGCLRVGRLVSAADRGSRSGAAWGAAARRLRHFRDVSQCAFPCPGGRDLRFGDGRACPSPNRKLPATSRRGCLVPVVRRASARRHWWTSPAAGNPRLRGPADPPTVDEMIRFAPHHLRHAHAIEIAQKGSRRQSSSASPGVRTSGRGSKMGRLTHGYHWGTAWRDLIHDQGVRV